MHRKTKCTQYSAPPTHHADSLAHHQSERIQLAHNQSENPMAQTSDGPPPQTSHAQSDPTTSARLRKLPTQLNTPNKFVPKLVRVSPNASDVQRLGQCVPALSGGRLLFQMKFVNVLLSKSGTDWKRFKNVLRIDIFRGLMCPIQDMGKLVHLFINCVMLSTRGS